MAYVVTGSPLGPFGDAVLNALLDDNALDAIVDGRIKASLKKAENTPLPYIVGARRDLIEGNGAGSMQVEGGKATMWLDFWSEKNGPDEVQSMMARARAVLSRRTLRLTHFSMIAGSLVCESEHVIPDFDPDMPQKSLFHGVQQWTALVEEING